MRRILIIDDDDIVRRTLCLALQDYDREILAAGNGAEALKFFANLPVHLVITDVLMPDEDGLKSIIEMRRLQPDMKFIAISGGGYIDHTDCLQFARNLGAARTLQKPFSLQQIQEAVSSLLN